MAVKVRIPAPLRRLTKDQAVVEVEGATIEQVIAGLEKGFPGLKERLCDETGQIRRFINVFVNGEDIRFKDGSKTAVAAGAEVSIIPAIAGGK
jgi:molybdopterin synthase sulfur carrier subunit